MLIAYPRSTTTPPRRRLKLMVMAGLAAVAGAAIAVSPASPAAADPGDPLGPTVVKTDQAPTGYAVKFRYQAPAGVTSVQVYGDWYFAQPPSPTPNHPPSEWQANDFAATDWRILPMTLGSDGVWETTVPLPAGTFRYAFTHNCTNQLATGCTLFYDPANPWQIFPQYPSAPGAVRSTIFVPSNPSFPTYDNDYQKPLSPDQMGTLESVRYPAPESTTPAGAHDMLVYTPKGYDPNRATPYPTLYISHGAGDHSTAWFMQGVAHYIVQNAINDGAVQPMVVVATDFNGLPGGDQGYANHLRNTVIPYMESHYNVSTRSQDRAFGGFSAGGSRAFTILYNNTDLFGYHASWSWGGPAANADQVARMKAVPGGIMIGTGLQDQTGNIGVASPARAAALRAQGVPLVEYNMNGMHTWHVWRPMLNYYIRNIAFRTTSTSLAVSSAASGATLTSTVGTVTAGEIPTGTVSFFAGSTEIGSAPLVNGVAKLGAAFTPSVLANGVVAKYQGSAVYNQSSSATATVTVPTWNSSTIYNTGEMASYNGAVWRASWWTKNQAPGGTSGPWQEIATGPDGVAVWTGSRIFDAGDTVTYQGSTWLATWWTQNQIPGSPSGPWQEIVIAADGTAVWTASRIFDVGAVVVHDGQKYIAQWWTRGNAPGQSGGPWKPTS